MRLPHWRLGDQLHHAAQPVYGHLAGVYEKHRTQGRDGNPHLDDVAVYHRFLHSLDDYASNLVLAGHPAWLGRST